jgi:hypothetical protein
MSVTNFRRASLKDGFLKTSDFADIPYVAPPAAGIVTAGLLRYYNVGNSSSYPGSGTTWTDLQSSGYNLTLVNGPTYTSNGAGSYLTFDGGNDYADGPDTGLPTGTSARTFQWWTYRLTNIDFNAVQQYGTIGGSTAWVFYTPAGNSPYSQSYSLDKYGGTPVANGTLNYPINQWVMLTSTYDNGAYEFFFNDSSVASGTGFSGVNTTLAGSTGLKVAASNYGAGNFNVNWGKLMIYNTKLSSTEVTTNFNATKADYGL